MKVAKPDLFTADSKKGGSGGSGCWDSELLGYWGFEPCHRRLTTVGSLGKILDPTTQSVLVPSQGIIWEDCNRMDVHSKTWAKSCVSNDPIWLPLWFEGQSPRKK